MFSRGITSLQSAVKNSNLFEEFQNGLWHKNETDLFNHNLYDITIPYSRLILSGRWPLRSSELLLF